MLNERWMRDILAMQRTFFTYHLEERQGVRAAQCTPAQRTALDADVQRMEHLLSYFKVGVGWCGWGSGGAEDWKSGGRAGQSGRGEEEKACWRKLHIVPPSPPHPLPFTNSCRAFILLTAGPQREPARLPDEERAGATAGVHAALAGLPGLWPGTLRRPRSHLRVGSIFTASVLALSAHPLCGRQHC